MGVMYKIRCALARFMYGRNGMDQLNRALFFLYVVLWLAGGIVSALSRHVLPNLLMSIALWAVFLLFFLRAFSKNLARRQEENRRWLNWWGGIRSRSAGARARHADKDHRYFTCKNCKAICRVPAGKGKIVITCPKCGAQIRGRS